MRHDDGPIVVDFSLYKLQRILEQEEDWQRAEVLSAMIDAYTDGLLSVDWEDGEPMFIASDEQIEAMEAIVSGSVAPE